MVGAANIDTRGQALNSATISSGSKPPLSGTTCTPSRATCCMMYMPEPWLIGAACRMASPGVTGSTSLP